MSNGGGVYSERVRSAFCRPLHAGEIAGDAGFSVTVTEGGAGARILLTAVTDGDRLSALRFRVFGCPHLIAAAEIVCERFEDSTVESLAEFVPGNLLDELEIPIEKTGRILLLEDALRSLRAQIDQRQR